jgi:hypothetical protein
MSKYNLTDIYEGMSNDEFEAAKEADRLEAHPDRDKIKAMQAMIAKERESRKTVKEMTGETYDRIDGLTNQVLKQRFMIAFSEIYEDMVEAGDIFDVIDVISYLSDEMIEFARDTKMDQGGMMESEVNEDKFKDLADKDEDIPADKKAIMAKVYRMLDKGATFDQVKKYLNEDEDSNDLDKKLSQVMFKLQDQPKEYIKMYMDSVARDVKRGDDAQYDDMSVDDIIEDYDNYIADKSMAEVKNHFSRFVK